MKTWFRNDKQYLTRTTGFKVKNHNESETSHKLIQRSTYWPIRIGIANSHWDTCSVSKNLDIQTSYLCIAHPGPSLNQPNRYHESSTCGSNNQHIHLHHVISNFESYQPSRASLKFHQLKITVTNIESFKTFAVEYEIKK